MGHVTGIDSLAYNSRALYWPPAGKLLLSVCLLVGSLSSYNLYGPAIVLGVGLFLFLYSVKGNLPSFILLLIAAVMAFNAVGVIIIAATQAGSPVFSISLPFIVINISQEGLDLAALVFLRSFAGLFVVLFFASSTPIPHIFNSLKKMGLPDYIAEITVLVYRYSFMILEQSEQMVNAAGCRLGFSGWWNYMRTTGTLTANLFIRSLEFAERSQNALQSRNFTGSFPVFREPKRITTVWIFLSLAVFASVYLIGNIR
ncbi:cobalt ECF transporter T component CbiQ [Methanocella sp. CWC-04]|uniref:Cobalt ECF transporter T component CbiQ n=1 Tax=Methanooceanicella nereidis TaxID=2052831 RepID=A0AAP2W7U1_9EURY|nr:cobalt ECF transporter T component CbiQ [Methanocella sp. CWC-04]MCD1295406.1 cobalt ECF transporter T component CbiQ [Methanocella sp. CWC-04]